MKTTSFTMTDEMVRKIEGFLSGTKSISQFAHEATEEKIKRMEVRDKNARLQLHLNDVEMLEPVITEILKRHGLI